MAKRKTEAEKILEKSRAAAARSSYAAPAQPVQESPNSVMSNTPSYFNELAALDAQTLKVVDLNDVEMRIGLLSRIILEHVLRLPFAEAKLMGVTARDKADIALRAISTLEGSKQEIRWKDELVNKPKKVDAAAYEAERAAVEERLKKVLYRKQELKIEAAEQALVELGEEPVDPDMN